MQEQEMDLIECINVLIRHKVIVIIFVIISAAVAVITTSPPKKSYDIFIIIGTDKTGIQLSDLVIRINEKTYDEKISSNLGLDLKNSGITFSASLIGSYMIKVKVNTQEKNIDNTIKAVNSLYEVIRREQEEELNSSSEQNTYQKLLLVNTISENKNELTYLEKKLKSLEKNETKLNDELAETKKKYKKLNDNNESYILNKNQSEKDQSIINYSQILQQKLNVINNIISQINVIESEKEALRINIRKFKLENEELKIDIDKLEKGYSSVRNVKLLKAPQVSEIITGRKKSAKILTSVFIGLIIGWSMAFFIEFYKNVKNKIEIG